MNRFSVVLFALCAFSLVAQEPARFGEKIDVNLVLLDAVVTDPKGNQILGLEAGDFVVRENGAEQKIESVEYFTNRTLLDAPEQHAPFKVERVRGERTFIFFFDKPQDAAYWGDVSRARTAVRKFVGQLRPGDRVAIVGHDVRLNVYSDITSDPGQLKRAIDEAGTFAHGQTSGSGLILRSMDRHHLISETGTVYEALRVLADSLRPIKGRKNLIVFSAGIYEPGQLVRDGIIQSESRYYRPMVQALNAADVSVYGMNLIRDVPDTPVFHQTLETMAAATNGEYYRHAVNFEPVLKRIERANNGYYLISYTSNHARGAHGFQKVSVSLKNPELRVKARQGYLYGDPGSE